MPSLPSINLKKACMKNELCYVMQHLWRCEIWLKMQSLLTSDGVIPCQVIQQNGDFSSDPHQNSRNFIRGKISGFWAQNSWNFLNRTYISEIMSIWNWCFLRGLDQKIIGVLLLELQLIITPLSLNIFIQYFAVKWKAPRLTKQHKVFHGWPLNPG